MKTAMIWGAAGGIGRAILAKLSDDGWFTIAFSRDSSSLVDPSHVALDAHFHDPIQVAQAVALSAQEVDEVDLWIYAAGDILSANVADMALDEWQQIIDANLTGPFLTLHHSLPLLASDAHIVLLGAISERLRLPGFSAYAAVKSGLEAFAEALRKEQPKKRVTVIRPGAVATPLWEKVPIKLPRNAVSPQKIAEKLLEAYHQSHKGQLTLV
jgi:NAD(P)-dependent dehydrogenase (short-subunit alcohol dehydrogenase family)